MNILLHLRASRERRTLVRIFGPFLAMLLCGTAVAGTIAQSPLYLGLSAPPLIMLTMERDHKLFYEAYNDASDVNGDGVLDVRYNPALPDPADATKIVDYAGYFDSHKCYSYGSGVFTPVSTTDTKKCSGAWSGDFLNYLTMSRMDALRRVLYGGYRSTDTVGDTVLERSYIPQDAHSWGKEYTSTAADGYAIENYTPLSQPSTGTRHLFANTTPLCPVPSGWPADSSACNLTGLPLLRVLTNSNYRVWEWLSIERAVAGVQCATGNNSRATCTHSASTTWEIVPADNFSSLTQSTYYSAGVTFGGTNFPRDHNDFTSLETNYGITSSALCTDPSHPAGCKFGSTTVGNINGSGNPNSTLSFRNENYFTIFEGTLVIPAGQGGSYTFAIDGDDAVEVIIDGTVVASWYGGHGSCNCQTHSGSITLSAGTHTIKFRHQEYTGGDNYYLYWQKTLPASTLTDYVVRVKACVSGLLESECRGYPADTPAVYKPTGILQEYGSSDQMEFGLITGSYAKNTSGGVLRKNISSFSDEFLPENGIFSNTVGIVKTIDRIKTIGFGSAYNYYDNCGVPEVGGILAEGRCRMWGNPVAEMMFEGLRYFGGKTSPTSAYSIASSGNDDATLGLPLPSWVNPYGNKSLSPAGGGYPHCSKPSQMVISDINPTNDTDQLPGQHSYSTPSATPSFGGDTSLNGHAIAVETLANTIWNTEYGGSTSLFIGQSGDTYDGAPTAKVSSSFGNIRGLSPEEPTKQGGYYAGSVAYYGKTNDLNAATKDQKVDSYSVALASPLPRMRMPIDANHVVTLVPFGKTVGGCGGVSATQGSFQPTNTIVDFYVDTIRNTDATNQDATVNSGRAYAKFRINYEDSEYGSDHDMDAIVKYELVAKANGSLNVNLTSDYAAGGCIQHMGYVISGTTADGVYLEVRDSDTGSGSDADYYLDNPNTAGVALPLSSTHNFVPGSTASASFVAHDPLWYAAKWGGFLDSNKNNALDGSEWDVDNNGVPDTYFLVTNAGKLKSQLINAFNEVVKRVSSSSSVATNSTSAGSDTLIYQARFNSGDWSGQIRAFQFGTGGVIGSLVWDTTTAGKFSPVGERKIFSYDPQISGSDKGIDFCWSAGCFTGAGTTHLSNTQKQVVDSVSYAANLTSSPIVSYLRGDQTREVKTGNGTYRNRSTVLGDIVNSDPVFVGTTSFGYDSLPSTAPERSSYASFRVSVESRTKMLYVGANDAMLHGFNATTGVESFAYVPNVAITSNLPTLTAQGYQHKYSVDGSPAVGDAYFFDSTEWRTVLVGTTGGGGRGVFALDVTFPDSFSSANVLWEFTSADDNDLGSTIPQAAIARLNNGHWGAIIANGYNSRDAANAADDRAVLFVLDLETGVKLAEINADSSSGNGLSPPVAVDVDTPSDRIIDYVYAGDLKGNLWKFDLTDGNPSNWQVAYSGLPLYVAEDTASPAQRQPITARPTVGPIGAPQTHGVMVYFGTGKYFENGDNILPVAPAVPQVHTFYGIWDQCDKASAVGCTGVIASRSALQQQTIDFQGTVPLCLVVDTATNTCTSVSTETVTVRTTTANPVDYGTTLNQKGWYLDLVVDGGTAQGERVVNQAVLRGTRVIFPTLIPSADACEDGGVSWLMEMNALTGQAPQSPVIDLNNDDKVDDKDRVAIAGSPANPSGLLPTGDLGIFKSPTILDCGGQLECKLLSGSSGDLGVVKEGEPGGGPGTGMSGRRRSWRQLR